MSNTNDNSMFTDDDINNIVDNMVNAVRNNRNPSDVLDESINEKAGKADNFMNADMGSLDPNAGFAGNDAGVNPGTAYKDQSAHDWHLPYALGLYDNMNANNTTDDTNDGFHNDKPYIDAETADVHDERNDGNDDVIITDITTDE